MDEWKILHNVFSPKHSESNYLETEMESLGQSSSQLSYRADDKLSITCVEFRIQVEIRNVWWDLFSQTELVTIS